MFGERALFLDRDGVVNVDHGYVSKPAQFEFITGLFPVLRRAAQIGYRIIIITNQSGIARGLYTEEDFAALSEWMRLKMKAADIPLSAVFFCPYLPDATIKDYKRDSFWRKPGPGMIMEAAVRHHIDLKRSLMVGDKLIDIEAAQAAGIGKPILLDPTGAVILPKGSYRLRSIQDMGQYF